MTTITEERREIGVTPVYERNRNATKKTVVNVGGARSSKSFSIAQLLIEKFFTEDKKRFVVARKTMPACKRSSYDLIISFLKDFGVYREDHHNKTDHVYRHKNNEILFMGLDEPTKIKSISTGINYVWLEEANEFTYDDYKMFWTQLSKFSEKEANHIYLTLNPTDENNWIAKSLILEDDVEVIHSTYRDNPFLSGAYIRGLENTINENVNYYRIYVLGEWGKLENLIYRNYKIIPELPDMDGAKWCYGLDFGLYNPSALLKIYLLNDRFYLEERFYKSGWTNADIIEALSHEEKGDIYADPTEKQMIEEIFRAGYNCYAGHKDVKAGIDLCQRQTLTIPESSDHLIKEIRGYCLRKDRNGNVLDEPIKFNDHLMGPMRWGIFGITERYGFATLRPGGDMPQSSRSMRI